MIRLFVVLAALIAMASSCQKLRATHFPNCIVITKEQTNVVVDTLRNEIMAVTDGKYFIALVDKKIFASNKITTTEDCLYDLCGEGQDVYIRHKEIGLILEESYQNLLKAISPCNNEIWLIENKVYSIFGSDITGYLSH